MIFFRFIPTSGALTKTGITILGILIGAIYGWCACGNYTWPSFMALVFFAGSAFTSGNGAIALMGGNNTSLNILSLVFFAGIFVVTDCGRAIAQRIISMRIARNKPWVLTLVILIAAYVPSVVVGGITGTLIIWNLLYGIFEEVGFEKNSGEKWPAIMILSTAFIANYGHNTLPFQVSNVATFGVLSAIDPSYQLPFGKFLVVTVLYTVISIFAFLLYIRYIVKPDVSKLKNYDNSKPVDPLGFSQKCALILFGLLFVLLMLGNVAGKTAVGKFINTYGNTAVVLFVLAIGLIIKKDGEFIFDFKEIATRAVPWPTMIMIATALCLAGTFSSDVTGINVWMASWITPILGGTSPVVLAVIILFACLVLTNVTNNSVVAFILVPILYSFHDIMGPTLTLGTMIMFMCVNNMAYLLPSGSANAALLFGQREWVSGRDHFTHVTISCLISFVLALVMLAIGSLFL